MVMTFYFYDLETSGINARAQRIMQFAGQRVGADFKPIGEPDNWLIALTDEIVPDPEAILVTGITPQKTKEEGYTEAEFLKLFTEQVCQPDTVIVGYNNVRFDDEFMRATLWRNFYDPYEWQWQDGRSRWDLLDVVRMVRALRPEGITWPIDKDGKPTNRLELLTRENKLDHDSAHDALSDVRATISVAKLLKEKQPKMFEYLLGMRSKKAVLELVRAEDPQPFLYTSGRYASEHQKTTAAIVVGQAEHGSVLVYDLRIDATQFDDMNDDELKEKLFVRDAETGELPVKVLKPNACPAVAPLGVLDKAASQSIHLTTEQVASNFTQLRRSGLATKINNLYEAFNIARREKFSDAEDPDLQLYDGFTPDKDKTLSRAVRSADVNELADFSPDFSDERLAALLPWYKARNYPQSLTDSERRKWDEYKSKRVMNGLYGQLPLSAFGERLAELAQTKTDDKSQFLLEELTLYGQSIAPTIEADG
ncbi:exodeoxyribonuclease I [Candidatus Saccharibacteria bacterium]|nr:exodeoxyribonuclease I [Candidatus Saccharibacteria bacterium]